MDFALTMAKVCLFIKKPPFWHGTKCGQLKKKALNVDSEPFFDALLAVKKIVIMKNPTKNSAIQSLPAASFCVIGSELF
jgi:hypothetical protein